MTTLTCKQICLPTPITQAQYISFAKPLSYDLRVVEHMNSDNNIVKVGLQVQIWEHDEFGNGTLKQYWKDVERVQVPYVATLG